MLTKEFLQKEYVDNDKTSTDLKNEFGIHPSKTWYWLKKHGIPAKPRGGGRKTVDLSGQTFGDLLVLEQIKGDGDCAKWKCRCSCGNIHEVKSPYLRRGEIKSCGKCKEHYAWQGVGEMSGWYYGTVKRNADRRGYEFNISKEYLWCLFLEQDRKCALTEQDIFFVRNITNNTISRRMQTASLDRIDNDRGYIEGNVQWVHKDVNRIKREYDQDYFIKICHMVSKTHPNE